jgi:hypothetical protein
VVAQCLDAAQENQPLHSDSACRQSKRARHLHITHVGAGSYAWIVRQTMNSGSKVHNRIRASKPLPHAIRRGQILDTSDPEPLRSSAVDPKRPPRERMHRVSGTQERRAGLPPDKSAGSSHDNPQTLYSQ